MADMELQIAEINKEIGGLKQSTKAAHSRMDRYELIHREDMKTLFEKIDNLTTKIDVVDGFMNRGKGYAAAFLLMAALAGAFLSKVIFRMIDGIFK